MPQATEKEYEKPFTRDPFSFVSVFPREHVSTPKHGLIQHYHEDPMRTEDIIKLLKPENTRKIFKTLNDLKRGKKRFIHQRTLTLLNKVAAVNVAVLPYHLQLYAGNLVIPCQCELNKLETPRKESWLQHLLAVFGVKMLR